MRKSRPKRKPGSDSIQSFQVGIDSKKPLATFHLSTRYKSTKRAPKIEISLARGEGASSGTNSFAPLRIPERIEAVLSGIDAAMLSGMECGSRIRFRPGAHKFPLGKEGYGLVEFAPFCWADLTADVGSPDVAGPDSGPSVRRIDVKFSRPVIIRNVINALINAQSLFEDRKVGKHLKALKKRWDLIRSLPPSAMVKRVGELVESADQIGDVALQSISARPVRNKRSGHLELRVGFNGKVRFLGMVPFPFKDVVLPSAILPVPFASLDRLLSLSPLATADLTKGLAGKELEVLRAAYDALHSMEGRFSIRARPPGVVLDTRTIDRTSLKVKAALPEAITLEGEFSGTVKERRLTLDMGKLNVGFPQTSLFAGAKARVDHDIWADEGPVLDRISLRLDGKIKRPSAIPVLSVEIISSHPLALGETVIPLTLTDIHLKSATSLVFSKGRISLSPGKSPLSIACGFRTPVSIRQSDRHSSWQADLLDGRLEATVEVSPQGALKIGYRGESSFITKGRIRVSPVPELSISRGAVKVALEGRCAFQGAAKMRFPASNAPHLDLKGGRFEVRLEEAELKLGRNILSLSPGTSLSGRIREAAVSASGPGDLAADLAWDLHGGQFTLRSGKETVPLLARGLRNGTLTVHLARDGRLSFSGGGGGLYGADFFNCLVNPAVNPMHLLNVLASEDAWGYVIGGLRLLNPELAGTAALLRSLVLGVQAIVEGEEIRKPADIVPPGSMARLLSLLLVGTDALQGRIEKQIDRMGEGRGFDEDEVKDLLRGELKEFGWDYEIDRIVTWINRVIMPTDPIRPVPAHPVAPLVEDPRFSGELDDLPGAGEIYEAIAERRVSPDLAAKIADWAPYYTLDQLAYFVKQSRPKWGRNNIARIRAAHEVKKRLALIADNYGGIEYAAQAVTIASFLGEAVGPLLCLDGGDATGRRSKAGKGAAGVGAGAAWPPPCALGPEDVAVLLKAGLGTGRQGRLAQINNRMLIELMASRPPDFLQEVFIELGNQSPRALSGILYAFLDQDQDSMEKKVNLEKLLAGRIEIPIPRRRDFMAGGRRANESFYEALTHVADHIIGRALPYLARKQHLQIERHAAPAAFRPAPRLLHPIDRAKRAIAEADHLGRKLKFTGREGKAHRAAKSAYEKAFRECAKFLALDRSTFQAPWLKKFWARNEEALKVLSVVRSYQEAVDNVRLWLHVRTGRRRFSDEQDLLRAVIRTLYADERDRKKLRADPLVRLLIDPPPGRYDFTVIACMGVITEGQKGGELEDAFHRLQERRGVHIVRADTGIACSLEYNAKMIEDAVRKAETPYGFITYSQGSPNGLEAESRMRGGTPEQQRLLDRFVCRNFLFSAANGSAHGTSGMAKFLRAMIEGERFLKHYQASFSSEAMAGFLRVVRMILDSRDFVRVLGGAHSLTHERAESLYRDGQLLDHAPSSSTRGVAQPRFLPEGLVYMYYTLDRLLEGAAQDTQVEMEAAEARAGRVINDHTLSLERCCIGSMPQTAHHWEPLTREIADLTTESDRIRAVYEGPKDRLVFPWIEVNARFGLIKKKR